MFDDTLISIDNREMGKTYRYNEDHGAASRKKKKDKKARLNKKTRRSLSDLDLDTKNTFNDTEKYYEDNDGY